MKNYEIQIKNSELLAHDEIALADCDPDEIVDCSVTLDNDDTEDTYCEICEDELEPDSILVNDGPARYEACLSHFTSELQAKLRAA